MGKTAGDTRAISWRTLGVGITVLAVTFAGVGAYSATTRTEPAHTTLYTPPPPEPPPAPPTLTLDENPAVLFVGDSLTDGNGATDKPRLGWVPQLALRMGWTNYRVDAFGLTGFLRPGGNEAVDRTYGTRVLQFHERDPDFKPDLVVFQGGFNDSIYGSSELAAAVRDTIENTRQTWPGAQFLVIGPITPRPTLNRITQAYQRGALLADSPAIDMNRKAAFDIKDADVYLTEDGWHPNDAGYALVAETLSTRIRNLINSGEGNQFIDYN